MCTWHTIHAHLCIITYVHANLIVLRYSLHQFYYYHRLYQQLHLRFLWSCVCHMVEKVDWVLYSIWCTVHDILLSEVIDRKCIICRSIQYSELICKLCNSCHSSVDVRIHVCIYMLMMRIYSCHGPTSNTVPQMHTLTLNAKLNNCLRMEPKWTYIYCIHTYVHMNLVDYIHWYMFAWYTLTLHLCMTEELLSSPLIWCCFGLLIRSHILYIIMVE